MEELFNKWMKLKYDVQFLAGIVQNPIEHVTHEDGMMWLNEYEKFMKKVQDLKNETLAILPRR
jgi:hypothetical protein